LCCRLRPLPCWQSERQKNIEHSKRYKRRFFLIPKIVAEVGNRQGKGTRIGSKNRQVKWTHRSNLRMLLSWIWITTKRRSRNANGGRLSSNSQRPSGWDEYSANRPGQPGNLFGELHASVAQLHSQESRIPSTKVFRHFIQHFSERSSPPLALNRTFQLIPLGDRRFMLPCGIHTADIGNCIYVTLIINKSLAD